MLFGIPVIDNLAWSPICVPSATSGIEPDAGFRRPVWKIYQMSFGKKREEMRKPRRERGEGECSPSPSGLQSGHQDQLQRIGGDGPVDGITHPG